MANASPRIAAEVSDLVTGELLLDSEYHPILGGHTQGGIANHYPMTVLSLQGLGASADEILAFRDSWPRYRAHVRRDLNLQDRGKVNSDNWHEFLGQPEYLLEFRRVFLQELSDAASVPAYVVEVIHELRQALPMGLFHPLIRVSFACVHGDNRLIADGLAYMAIRYFDLYLAEQVFIGSSQHDANGQDMPWPENCWRHAHEHVQHIKLTKSIGGGSLRICEQLCAEPDVQAIAFGGGFTINDNNLQQCIQHISLMALRLYLNEPALTTLHGVTACQALADISLRAMNVVESRAGLVQLWRHYWVWLTGLYLEKGAPASLPTIDPLITGEINGHDWSNLAAGARQIPEVHLIKMVFSCKWLYENIEPNDMYKLAAVKILIERNAHPRSRYGLSAE